MKEEHRRGWRQSGGPGVAEVARCTRRHGEVPPRPRSSATLQFGEFGIDLEEQRVKVETCAAVTAVHVRLTERTSG